MKWAAGIQGLVSKADLVSKANQAKHAAQQAASMVSDAVAADGLSVMQQVQGALKQRDSEESIDADSLARMSREDLEALFLNYARQTKAAEKERKALEETLANHVPLDAIEEDPLVELRQEVTALNEQLQLHTAELREYQNKEVEAVEQRKAAATQKEEAVADLEKNKSAIAAIEKKLALVDSRTGEALERLEEKSRVRLAEQEAAIEQLESAPRAGAEEVEQEELEVSALRQKHDAAKAAAANAEEAQKEAKNRVELLKQAREDLERTTARGLELEQEIEDSAVTRRQELEVMNSKLHAARAEIEALHAELEALPPREPIDKEIQAMKDRIREQCGKNARIREHVRTLETDIADRKEELGVLASSLNLSQAGSSEIADEFPQKLAEAERLASEAASSADEMAATCEAQIAALFRDIKADAKQKQEQQQELNEALRAAQRAVEEKEERLRATQEEVAKIRSSMPSAQKVQSAQARIDDLEEAIRRVGTKIQQAEEENRSLESDRPPTLEATERRGVVLSVTVDNTVWVLLGADGNKLRWWRRNQLLLDDSAIGDPLEVVLQDNAKLLEQGIEKAKQELEEEKLRLERTEAAFSAFRQTISSKLATSVAPELDQREKDHKRLAAEIDQMEKELLQDERKQQDILTTEKEVEADIAHITAQRAEKQAELEAARLSVQELEQAMVASSKVVQDVDEEVVMDKEQLATLDAVRERLRKSREEVSAYEVKISEERRRIRRIKRLNQDDPSSSDAPTPSPHISVASLDRASQPSVGDFLMERASQGTVFLPEYQPAIATVLSGSGTTVLEKNPAPARYTLPVQAYSLNIEAVQDDIEKLKARVAAVKAQRDEARKETQAVAARLEESKQQLRSQTVLDSGKETEYFRNVFRSAIATRPITPETTPLVHVLWQFFDFAPEELVLLDKKRAAKENSSWW